MIKLVKTTAQGQLLLLLMVLSGCTTYSLPGGQPAPVDKPPAVAPAPQTPAPPVTRPPDSPSTRAWQPLVDKASQATARGDYEQALALLERAQRIDPDSATIYLELARTHQARGDSAQARATAERGMLYCTGRSQCDALRTFLR